MKKILRFTWMLLLFTMIMGCAGKKEIQEDDHGVSWGNVSAADIEAVNKEEAEGTVVAETVEEVIEEPVFEEYELQLMALGDNLLHTGIVATGKQEDGSYNFDFLFLYFFGCIRGL